MAIQNEKKYTADEFFSLSIENGEHWELVDGKPIMQAMPNVKHQIISAELYSIFKEFIKNNNGKCKPYPSLDVKLDDYNTVIPDFMVVCDSSKLDEKRCNGAPDFVVEIVSSNRYSDFIDKLSMYQKYGVREYWIIDPKYKRTITYFFENGEFPNIYTFDMPIPVGIYNGELEINIDELLK
jgi:hypothetical protein